MGTFVMKNRCQQQTFRGSSKGLTLASKITVCRILIVPVFIATVLYYSPDQDYLRFAALGVFALALALDILDGYLARRLHQETRAGALLDPLADKILLISAYICLYKVGILFDAVRFPIWLVVAVISRDVILLLGFMVIRLNNGEIAIKPTGGGKMTVFFEAMGVIGILLQWPWSPLIWPVVMVFVVVSGIDYIYKGIKILNNGDNIR